MRLIDADALIAQLKCDTKDCDKCPANDYWFGCGKVKEFIGNAPTIDVVSVVRCKDCFLYDECQAAKFYGDDGYCSCGKERR